MKKIYWIFGIVMILIVLIAYYIIFYSEFSPIRTFCSQDDDCEGSCSCGCINKNMYCDEQIVCELGPHPCKCVNNKCESIPWAET
ncbi:MAG: hypothetical protein GTN36_01560 [Candidatus Aenigmarchaeota archaeon]|nr:hypothetical protein [Candidatus Aenigmarchaeota archaeon]